MEKNAVMEKKKEKVLQIFYTYAYFMCLYKSIKYQFARIKMNCHQIKFTTDGSHTVGLSINRHACNTCNPS